MCLRYGTFTCLRYNLLTYFKTAAVAAVKNKEMNKKLLQYSLALLFGTCTAFSPGKVVAQTINSIRNITGTTTSTFQNLYIGPDANITVDGTWNVYAETVYIDPAAKIQGSGVLNLYKPADVGGPDAATKIDGNNVTQFVGVNINLQNNKNLELADLTKADNAWTTYAAAGLNIGSQLVFGISGGDVITNDYKLTLAASASLSGYATDRYVVTNTATGELVKQGIPTSGSFFFPIGRAEGGDAEFSPAYITVNSGGPVDYHTNVSDYSTSTSDETYVENTTSGYVNRTWLIYGGTAGTNATVNLIHKTGAGIDVPPYTISSSNLLRYDGAGGWVASVNKPELDLSSLDVSILSGYWAQNLAYAIPAAIGANTYLTKSSITADLTPVIRLPQNNFGASGVTRNLVVELQEVLNVSTVAGVTEFSITVPSGFSIAFDNTIASIDVSGGSTTAIQNNQWTLTDATQLGGRKLVFKANPGVSIGALQKAVIGFTVTRTTSSADTSPVILVNITDDATSTYDSNSLNNIFNRIINAL